MLLTLALCPRLTLPLIHIPQISPPSCPPHPHLLPPSLQSALASGVYQHFAERDHYRARVCVCVYVRSCRWICANNLLPGALDVLSACRSDARWAWFSARTTAQRSCRLKRIRLRLICLRPEQTFARYGATVLAAAMKEKKVT